MRFRKVSRSIGCASSPLRPSTVDSCRLSTVDCRLVPVWMGLKPAPRALDGQADIGAARLPPELALDLACVRVERRRIPGPARPAADRNGAADDLRGSLDDL